MSDTKATKDSVKMLNAEHARRMAHAAIEDACIASGAHRERALAYADAYTADFIERVERYTDAYDAAEKELVYGE